MIVTIIGWVAIVVFCWFALCWLIDDQGGFRGWECICLFAFVYWKITLPILVIGGTIIGVLIGKRFF